MCYIGIVIRVSGRRFIVFAQSSLWVIVTYGLSARARLCVANVDRSYAFVQTFRRRKETVVRRKTRSTSVEASRSVFWMQLDLVSV